MQLLILCCLLSGVTNFDSSNSVHNSLKLATQILSYCMVFGNPNISKNQNIFIRKHSKCICACISEQNQEIVGPLMNAGKQDVSAQEVCDN